ncbi:MAG: replication protein RepA [Bryobacteraceae bacterium]
MSSFVSSSANRHHSTALQPAGQIFKELHSDLLVSKQKLERVRGIELVRIKRDQRMQDLCFSSRPFVLCGLPVRRLPKDQLLYERRNGRFVLQVTGHADFGMHTGGKEYRRLVEAFERIFGATIFFGTDTLSGKAKVVQRARFNFLREAQIWYTRTPNQRVLSADFENLIMLSDDFYQEIVAHPVPNDLESVKPLAASPAVLDLYMWLSYRCFKAKGVETIPIFGEFGLANQIGTVEYSRPRRFRAMLEQWLRTIRAMWPECPARISSDGRSLVIQHAPAILPREAAHV